MAQNLTVLTNAVDFSSAVVAILGVSAALVVVYVAWKAALMVVITIRGNSSDSTSLRATPVDQISEAEFNKFENEHKEWLGVTSYADYCSRYTST